MTIHHECSTDETGETQLYKLNSIHSHRYTDQHVPKQNWKQLMFFLYALFANQDEGEKFILVEQCFKL